MRVPPLLKKVLLAAAGAAALLGASFWALLSGWLGPGFKVLKALPGRRGDAVVGLDLKWENADPVSKRVGDFYVDDPAVLKRMSEAWVSKGIAPFFLCGYNYDLNLVSDGQVVDSYAVNLEKGCNTIVDRNGRSHWFDPAIIERFEGELKKPRIEEAEFKSLAEARARLAAVEKDPKLLLVVEPLWRTFDGEFRISPPCEPTDDVESAALKCREAVAKRIRERYPSEEFLASDSAAEYQHGKLSKLTLKVTSSEAFMRKFDLYEVEKGSWRPLKLGFKAAFRQ